MSRPTSAERGRGDWASGLWLAIGAPAPTVAPSPPRRSRASMTKIIIKGPVKQILTELFFLFVLFYLCFLIAYEKGFNQSQRVYDDLLWREQVTNERLLSRYLHTDSMFNSIFTSDGVRALPSPRRVPR